MVQVPAGCSAGHDEGEQCHALHQLHSGHQWGEPTWVPFRIIWFLHFYTKEWRIFHFWFLYIFWISGRVSLYPEILQYCTMTMQRPRIIVGDAGFESGTSATEIWRATNEPPHLLSPLWAFAARHFYKNCFTNIIIIWSCVFLSLWFMISTYFKQIFFSVHTSRYRYRYNTYLLVL